MFQQSSSVLSDPVEANNNAVSMTPSSASTGSSATTETSGHRKSGRTSESLSDSSVPLHLRKANKVDTDERSRRQCKSFKLGSLNMPTLPYSDYPRDIVDYVLMTYDGLRRWCRQLEETDPKGNKQIHLMAYSRMKEAKLTVNQENIIGGVPGVEIGDIFYFRVEMCLIGIHSKVIPGIDYKAPTSDNDTIIATCIVSSDAYGDDQGDPSVLIYTGSGNEDKDQELSKGNLALNESKNTGNLIRVIRSATDSVTWSNGNNKIYIYDGLYMITRSWTEIGKKGFLIYKHKLVREPGQPDGIALWNEVEKWREDPSSRDHLILSDISDGAERTKVCVVNEVDPDIVPAGFIYTTRASFSWHNPR